MHPRRRGRAGLRWGHAAALLAIGFVLVWGMGAAEAYMMAPCAGSPVFAAAGEHGRGLCYALKGSMLGPALAGELILLCILLLLLAAVKARLDVRVLGTAAGWRAMVLAGAALMFTVNTPVTTSSLILAGCHTLPPAAAEAEGADGAAAWCRLPVGAHPMLFEKESKMTGQEYFGPRSLQRLRDFLARP